MTISPPPSDRTGQARHNGMCGDRSPHTSLGPRKFCELEAGHSGWHEAPDVLHEKYGLIDGLRWSDPMSAID